MDVVSQSLASKRGQARPLSEEDDVPTWLEEFDEVSAYLDDEELAEIEDDATDRSQRLLPDAPGAEGIDGIAAESELLDRMSGWASRYEARPDAKARVLIEHVKQLCCPDGAHWTDERIVVFTEYRDTQAWLADLLRQEGLAGDRLALLHGGVSPD